MAKLYFYYSSMNAGKSMNLLQAAFNYGERGMRAMLFSPMIDTRSGPGKIRSRVGPSQDASPLSKSDSLYDLVAAEGNTGNQVSCVLIDEAQFLTEEQVWQAARVADFLKIPVLCYGLRTDFQGKLFPGSSILLGIADELVELKGVCECGRKSTMNLRVDGNGHAIANGPQVDVGGNERYIAVCRRHFQEAIHGNRWGCANPAVSGNALLPTE